MPERWADPNERRADPNERRAAVWTRRAYLWQRRAEVPERWADVRGTPRVGAGGNVASPGSNARIGDQPIRTFSGRPLDEITVDAVLGGEVTPDDVRIHPDTLRLQADVAERHGNPQLAENLRRAAELASVPDDELLAIYEALRPYRSTRAQLEEIAARLQVGGAPVCASFVREALEVYERRRLLR